MISRNTCKKKKIIYLRGDILILCLFSIYLFILDGRISL